MEIMRAPNLLGSSRIKWHYIFTQCLASTMSTNYSFSKYAYYMVAIILIDEVDDAMRRQRERRTTSLCGMCCQRDFPEECLLKLWLKDEWKLTQEKQAGDLGEEIAAKVER